MKNDKEILQLRCCPICESDNLVEIYEVGKKLYKIKCNFCGFTSEGSMVQNEAAIIWNKIERFSEEIEFLKQELRIYEHDLRRNRERIDELEDDNLYLESEIHKIEKRMEDLKLK